MQKSKHIMAKLGAIRRCNILQRLDSEHTEILPDGENKTEQ